MESIFLVEKPAVEEAPPIWLCLPLSSSPRVMELLAEVKPGAGGEIQLTDALDAVLKEEEMYALVIDPEDGYDTGTIESWLDTNNRLYKSCTDKPSRCFIERPPRAAFLF